MVLFRKMIQELIMMLELSTGHERDAGFVDRALIDRALERIEELTNRDAVLFRSAIANDMSIG